MTQDFTLMLRIDASKNMARFYALTTAPTLFGETCVVRNWGRIGTGGKLRIATFPTAEQAVQEMARLKSVKQRRGYVSMAK